jgi:hypothetical protein
MKISEHITYEEATKSSIAKRFGFKNKPNKMQLGNIVLLAEKVFEPLRKGLGGYPLIIVSFFRSKDLNYAVGGAVRSQHLANIGAAMDIDNDRVKEGPSNKEIFGYIKDNLEFDQLISEFPDSEGNPDWVHVSFNNFNNRKQIFECVDGKYIKYEKNNLIT